jgi:type VI secretion system protein ImpM
VPADAVTSAHDIAPGFYGKLPARGDFVGRRLGRPFIDAWDGWLQQAILASRDTLGTRWLETYLTSPLWRFALGAGCCGPRAAAGVVMPSVDKVGRYYPLMLGREFTEELDPTGFAPTVAPWHQALEDLALSALSDDFDLAAFDNPIRLDIGQLDVAESGGQAAGPLPSPGRHLALADGAVFADLCRENAGSGAQNRRTLWWTSGSEHVAPCLLICPGMPAPEAFPSLLDGDFPSRGWQSAAVPLASSAIATGDEPAWDREE